MSYKFREKDADERKTYDEVFDHKTLMTLYSMMSKNTFDIIDFPLATGKEGNVFRADTKDGKHLAVKIYRVSNSTFKNIQKYIVGDQRFKSVGKNHRRGIYLWAQKEFRNLERMHGGGISVPKPIACSNNVVVMEYIGTETTPAKHLKDVELADPVKVYEKIHADILTMYQDVGLVHADLSEYNILMRQAESESASTGGQPVEEPIIIDVGQAVLKNHPMADEFLERDITNIARFFTKKGVELDVEKLIAEVKGE